MFFSLQMYYTMVYFYCILCDINEKGKLMLVQQPIIQKIRPKQCGIYAFTVHISAFSKQ